MGQGPRRGWIPDAGVGRGTPEASHGRAALWGSEYGAAKDNGIERFARRHNPKGYWIAPMLKATKPMAKRDWQRRWRRLYARRRCRGRYLMANRADT